MPLLRPVKSRASLISMDKAMSDVKAGNPSAFLRGKDATPDNPGTSHFTVVDSDGLVVSMTTTVEAPFGSQRMAAGFMLNNQLTDFSFRAVDDEVSFFDRLARWKLHHCLYGKDHYRYP